MSPSLVEFKAALVTALTPLDVAIEPVQFDALQAHFEAVIEANRRTNLTRITEPMEAAVKHYADSLALLPWARDRHVDVTTVLDVGTGAGFPAFPIAVVRSDWSVTAIDATRKKSDFVQRAAEALGLTNLRCEHAHAQHWKPPARFDLVIGRALARFRRALVLLAGHVRPGGWVVVYQTAATLRDNAPDVDAWAAELGLDPVEVYPYALRLGEETLDRVLCVYRKRERNVGTMLRNRVTGAPHG